MANFERYEPRGDRGRVFDGGEIQDGDEEGSRLPLLLVIGLLVVAAFAGVVWLAYTQGVERGRADAPRMLVAAGGPENAAARSDQNPLKGLKIYQQPAPPEDEVTDATPQPPTPAPKLAEAPQASPAANVAPASANVPSAPPPQVATHSPRPLVSETRAAPAPRPSMAASSADSAGFISSAGPETSKAGALLQVGAYKSAGEADAAWQAFRSRHTIATRYRSDVKKVDLGEKGIWYRLRIGPFSGKSAAAAFCDELRADGGTCILAR